MNWSYVIAAAIVLLTATLTIGAVKGFTLARTLRIGWWGILHPFQRPPDDL